MSDHKVVSREAHGLELFVGVRRQDEYRRSDRA